MGSLFVIVRDSGSFLGNPWPQNTSSEHPKNNPALPVFLNPLPDFLNPLPVFLNPLPGSKKVLLRWPKHAPKLRKTFKMTTEMTPKQPKARA